VEQTATDYVSTTSYEDNRAKNIAIDEGRKLVYVTGGSSLNIYKLGSGDSLKHLKEQTFAGSKLGSVRWCGNYITIVVADETDPGNVTLEVFKVYNKKSGLDVTSLNSIPLGPAPGRHRHSADCQTVIVPIGATAYTDENGMEVDDDGMITIVNFDFANLARTWSTKDLTFDSYATQIAVLRLAGGIFEFSAANFSKGIEPNDVAFGVNDTVAYVSCGSNNLIVYLDMATQAITSLEGLGFKDMSETTFDPNDKNGISIGSWPQIQAAYSPGRIECYTSGGVDYLYMVNEGIPLYRNTVTLRSVSLDPGLFPNTTFADRDQAGRLMIWSGGDYDNDGDFDFLIMMGTRGVAVWHTVAMIFLSDSQNAIETAMATEYPDLYNSDTKFPDRTVGDNIDFRSNVRGPEPRSISIFTTCKEKYLVVIAGLEMPGGIIGFTVDLSAPESGFTYQFVQQNVANYTMTSTWGELWTAQTSSLLDVEDMTLLPGRSPVLLTAASHTNTVEAFKVRVKCSG